MRQDMHRLTTIRSLDVVGQRKLLSRGNPRDLEALPTHQSMRSSVPHYTYPRVLKFSPALRWLQQQAGRPWNDVYAEMRQRFDVRNTQQGVVLEQLLDKVERDVYFEGGRPRHASAYGSWEVSGLYVHPDNGLLLLARPEEGAKKQRADSRKRAALALASRRIDVSDTLQLHLVKELWFWVELAPIEPPKTVTTKPYVSSVTGKVLVEPQTRVDWSSVCRDALTGQQFLEVPTEPWNIEPLVRAYGKPLVYAKRKWQASHRDVERHVKAH